MTPTWVADGIIFAAALEGTAEAPGADGAGVLAAGTPVPRGALALPVRRAHAAMLTVARLAGNTRQYHHLSRP